MRNNLIKNEVQTRSKSQSVVDNMISRLISGLNVYKIILFGSYASGESSKESDIDLMVVLNENTLPANYDEYMTIYLRVSSLILDIRRENPVDLIVHTRKMHEKFIELKSMFSKEILKHGRILYEANH